MRRHRRNPHTALAHLIGLLSLLLPLTFAAGLTPAGAQTADDLFNAATLQDLRLTMNASDLALLREHYLENTYYPADMAWGDIRLRNIGIRSRGSGSRNPQKLGLKLDFDEYVKGQTFLGFKELILDNFWQDPSMIREEASMALFNRLGQAAPREVFVRFFINGTFEGVYTIVEPINEQFLTRTLNDDSGYLFDYEWVRNFYADYPGDDLAIYKEMFSAETRDDEPDNAIYQPVSFLFREVNAQDDAGWQERTNEFIDLRQFVTQAAIETFLAERDGLLGDWGMNNFYLYRSANSRQHRVFPWDKDNTFQAFDASIVDRLPQNVLMRRAIAREDLRNLYLEVLEACARSAMQDDWLLNHITARADLIAAAARQDPRKPTTSAEFDEAVAFLKDFAVKRPAWVLEQVAIVRGERPPSDGEGDGRNARRAPRR